MILFVITISLTILAPNVVYSRQTGAPFESCLTLTPKHGSQPSQPPMSSPFVINVTKVFDETLGTEKVELKVHSPVNKTMFKGFVIQARYANNPDIVVDGEFLPNESLLSRTYVCKPGETLKSNNTWTHRNNKDKLLVTAVWTPPDEFSETVVFVGTIVKDKATFWEHQHSTPLLMGSLVGLEENETMKPDMESTEGTDHSNMESDEKTNDDETTKASAMAESAFSNSNFTETVPSTHSSASRITGINLSIILVLVLGLFKFILN